MAHAYNFHTVRGQDRQITSGQEFTTSLTNVAKPGLYKNTNMVRPPSLQKKNTKISQSWWLTPVMPATQGAGSGESLEPRRWRLQ